jgi:hypothetical protein
MALSAAKPCWLKKSAGMLNRHRGAFIRPSAVA